MDDITSLVTIAGMVTAIALKTIGLYFAKKEAGDKFKPEYAITAVMGVFMAYTAFAETVSYNLSYVDMFMQSAFYGLGMNLMFDVPAKMVKK